MKIASDYTARRTRSQRPCEGKTTLPVDADVLSWCDMAAYFSVRNKSVGIIENYLQVTM